VSTEASRITDSQPCLPPLSNERKRFLLQNLLRDVSRSFYLTLRVLPAEIRPQISLAYLLARASDTIADTKAVSKQERIEMLRQFTADSRLKLGAVDGSPAEQRLLACLDDCFAMLASLSDEDQRLIRTLHQTIIRGQTFDLEEFPGEREEELVALADNEELDRYTYLVAGCVGEFWTRICQAHIGTLECWNDRAMERRGVRFGKGLQLVNILRDIPRDLRIGRCYLPVSDPKLLLDPNNFTVIEPVYKHWLDTALAHLDAGWEYTLAIPPSLTRLRLACIWPIWIGLKTIARLRVANPLGPTRRVKVSRGEVYWLMVESFLICRNDDALDEKYRRLRARAT
jgi:farnesyl-diphosphate farnesyltransferase